MKNHLALYNHLGINLVALHPKTKQPIKFNWNQEKKSDKIKRHQNVGVKLSFSGLCCFDIDDLKQFKKLSEKGGYWKLIQQGTQYTSGKKNRLKILFRCKPLKSMPLGAGTGEFRCTTEIGLTLQDVLPPSKHPEGTKYKWLTSTFKYWTPFDVTPEIPKLPKKLKRMITSYNKSKRPTENKFKAKYVEVFNEECDDLTVDSLISEIGGYTPVIGGWRRIGSSNVLAIKVYNQKDAYNFSNNDEQSIRRGPLDLYNLFVIARFEGDEKKARKWVCKEMRKQVDDAYNQGREFGTIGMEDI
jgi:hypothetical protein